MTDSGTAETTWDLQHKVRDLLFLERIVRLSTSTPDYATMLRTIIDETTAVMDAQVCSLYLWDDAEHVLVLTATNGLSAAGIGSVKLGLGEGITGWVAAQRSPVMVRDVRHEPRFKWVPNFDEEHLRSMVSVPIISRDRVVGVMNVQTSEVREFSQEAVEFLLAIAAQLAGIIELSQLQDKLTKQLELEREAVASLQVLNQSKSDMLSMLSHDFRGPLTIAKSYLHGLMVDLDGEKLAASKEIDLELENLERMADNLLISLQVESLHTMVLDLGTLDLTELITSQARRMQYTSPDHCITITAPVAVMVEADAAKVQAVVANLLGNAIKYSPVGGPIAVEIVQRSEEVEVTVADHGIGIDTRETDILFERYGRGDRAIEKGISGHGLGLFICKQIIDAHAGRIYARPVADGSCFVFTLPQRRR